MFDPISTLLAKDVTLHSLVEGGKPIEYLAVHIKSLKEQKLSTGITVELFETGSEICPVSAFKKWRATSRLTRGTAKQIGRNKPLIRLEEGTNYTGKSFNSDLKKLLSPYLNYDHGKILSHSFRYFPSLLVY